MFTFQQLEYITALDNERHFARAANKCQITQPTLSMQLKKMEDDIGVSIFDRSRQPIIPTLIGEEIIQQARSLLRHRARLIEIVENYNEGLSGELTIGILPTLAPYLLPLFAGDIMKNHPDLILSFKEMKTNEIIDALHNDELDAAILSTPLRQPAIIEEVLFYEEIKLYCNPKSKMYQKSEIKTKDIDSNEIWMLSDGNCFRDHVINICAQQKNKKKTNTFQYDSGSIETLKRMVDIQGGYTLIPELAVLDLPSRKLARVKSFVKPQPMREISLVYVRDVAKRKFLTTLKEFVLAAVPEEFTTTRKGHVVEWR